MTKDEKHALSRQQIQFRKGFIIPFISWNWGFEVPHFIVLHLFVEERIA